MFWVNSLKALPCWDMVADSAHILSVVKHQPFPRDGCQLLFSNPTGSSALPSWCSTRFQTGSLLHGNTGHSHVIFLGLESTTRIAPNLARVSHLFGSDVL